MGAKYVSGSMRWAGSVEESRAFFPPSPGAASVAPLLQHYLQIAAIIYAWWDSIQFTNPHCSQRHGQHGRIAGEASRRGACQSVARGFQFSVGRNKYGNDLLLWNKHRRRIHFDGPFFLSRATFWHVTVGKAEGKTMKINYWIEQSRHRCDQEHLGSLLLWQVKMSALIEQALLLVKGNGGAQTDSRAGTNTQPFCALLPLFWLVDFGNLILFL